MNKERLFELAVSLAAANISAGQFQNNMNFGTIVRDFTETAYDQLTDFWKEISDEPADEADAEPDGGTGNEVTH